MRLDRTDGNGDGQETTERLKSESKHVGKSTRPGEGTRKSKTHWASKVGEEVKLDAELSDKHWAREGGKEVTLAPSGAVFVNVLSPLWYEDSIDMRPIQPMYADLVLWAVMAGQPAMAKLLWAKTIDPLRVALLASLYARSKAETSQGHQQERLEEHQANIYEDWAIGILDECTVAAPRAQSALLLTAFPV